jgi:hypothetical protein
MSHNDDSQSEENDGLRAGECVRLRERHALRAAGTPGRIIGFYVTEPREVLVALDDGEELRVPYPKLERLP